ncbi:Epoxide hydrolase protein [Rutstroemia sp. NJR-2017a BVV2]|nr:Epoxide hydrolase protein [Rutstroemia sp. NJR-2017a BVV2]
MALKLAIFHYFGLLSVAEPARIHSGLLHTDPSKKQFSFLVRHYFHLNFNVTTRKHQSNPVTMSTTKSHTTSRSLTYSYIHHPPTSPSKPTLLFLHGFPSGPHDFFAQITYFTSLGYGALAPHLLGYGPSSHPLDVRAYAYKPMVLDLIEILDREDIREVIGVGHDWGSAILSRLVNYFPERVTKLVFLDIGYSPPGWGFSREVVRQTNSGMREGVGWEGFGYFLGMEGEGVGGRMGGVPLSVMSLFYSNDAQVIKDNMGATGGFEKWLEEGKVAGFEDWVTEDMIAKFKDYFSPANGGFDAARNWYCSQLEGVNEGDEKELPPDAAMVKQPTLLITTDNIISAMADFPAQMKQLVTDLRVEKVGGGHWVMLERKEETNEVLRGFLEG